MRAITARASCPLGSDLRFGCLLLPFTFVNGAFIIPLELELSSKLGIVSGNCKRSDLRQAWVVNSQVNDCGYNVYRALVKSG